MFEICDAGGQVLFICNNCGATSLIGLDDYMDGKAWYSQGINNEEINDTHTIKMVVASRGNQIWMNTGGEATAYYCDFIDWKTPKPNDILEEEWDKVRRSVNTHKTINLINDEDKIRAMCSYGVRIDWTGTKYERK